MSQLIQKTKLFIPPGRVSLVERPRLLIDAQPPQMRLALLSREDLGIQLARRRARDLNLTLLEVRCVEIS